MTDEELLENISRKGRLIQAVSSVQGRLINEAKSRGIPTETILNAQRVAKVTEVRRSRNRGR